MLLQCSVVFKVLVTIIGVMLDNTMLISVNNRLTKPLLQDVIACYVILLLDKDIGLISCPLILLLDRCL